MPASQYKSREFRDFRTLLSRELPLPTISSQPIQSSDGHEKYEAVVIGPRTLEVLKSLDVADEILNHGCHMSEPKQPDHIWAVVETVADMKCPDVRKRCAIHSAAGYVMIIPREHISTDQYLTRLHAQIKDEIPVESTDHGNPVARKKSRSNQKAGQGMNVSMMHSYNLAWKLAHEIYSLSPEPPGASVLNTYESELVTVGRMLVEFDTKFTSVFSGQIGSDSFAEGLNHEQFLKVCSDGSNFTSDCGIEYLQSITVEATSIENSHLFSGDIDLHGTSKPGRRLPDSVAREYADSHLRHLQDDFLSTGRLRILVFTTSDLLEPHGNSSRASVGICNDTIPTFQKVMVELVVIQPFVERVFEWTDVPTCVKEFGK
ncbi:hypothetical protein BOTNAR_0388g00020 [Botryotinia narcissicola]|uniref:FAD-binding domain-containing protein n=1 Tax=Botryotinia narcissicola TaxID=278944 RepID=A0A4Z1HTN2_9HELO|nr:hypothetical protein BOTNAR_0388g00020 [Botryotinia narcissicola]